MKSKKQTTKIILALLTILVVSLFGPGYTRASGEDITSSEGTTETDTPSASPTPAPPSYQASVSVDRPAGQCSYSIRGIDLAQTSSITLQAARKDNNNVVLKKTIDVDATNCTNGIFNGSFSLADVKNTYTEYNVSILVGSTTVTAGACDFSIHTKNIKFTIEGNKESNARTMTMTSSEPANGVLVPGAGNQLSVYAWANNTNESTAKLVGANTNVSGNSLAWTMDTSLGGVNYGIWNTKLVLTNTNNPSLNMTLAKANYEVNPIFSSLTTTKTSALEKKKSFGIYLKGLKNPYAIKTVQFSIFNSKGSKVATVNGTLQNSTGTRYYAAVSLKKLGYKLGKYTVKASFTDVNNSNKTLDATATVDESVQKGTLSVTKKKNAVCTFKLSNAYIPGNIKKVEFVIYKTGKKTKKIGKYKAKAKSGKKQYTVSVNNVDTGTFKVRAYGYTNWGTKILINSDTYKIGKKDMGKNGWYYEKYKGTKYKFYYINNVKQTDLTKQLKIKKSSSSHTNNFYIEVNRAACVVTIYMYNDETKKYDIPVKTCTVSVGSDVSTVAGAGGLNTKSYYTPLGNYSICTNGQSVKYTLKPMNEPDGKILYARWATHIVGNVYFHGIAVGAQSHYSLPASTYNRLGSPASAGCIRMTIADAKWIYDYASTGTKVKIIKGSASKPGPLGKNPTIKSNVNYDPTDPAVPLSRKKKDYKAKRISGYMTSKGEKVGY